MPQFTLANFPEGQTTNPLAFNIDNKAFAYLYNAYVWRGRVKRKRGTIYKGQLTIQLQLAVAPNRWQQPALVVVAGVSNLLTGYPLGSNVTPFSISLTNSTTLDVYTDPNGDGTLDKNGVLDAGSSINYVTGVITIAGGLNFLLIGSYQYFPHLPVMALADFTARVTGSMYPLLVAFDTKYAYQCDQSAGVARFFNVTYYKDTSTPFTWNGGDFQQFYTTNYPSTTEFFSGALWATNNVPGFHFMNIQSIAAGNPTTITTATPTPFFATVPDWVFFYEVLNDPAEILNGKSFQITWTSATTFTVPADTTTEPMITGGIFQMLTNTLTSSPAQDGIRWYDGDPTNNTGLPTGTGFGWVNFSPPLTASGTTVSIAGSAPRTYYLVGALMILPFQDRLLFFSPYIQAITGPAIKLQDTILWSQVGTPFYSAPVPTNQTFDPKAYIVNQTGLGGYLPAGVSDPISTVGNNENVLLVGFGGGGRKTRFVPTGDDIDPFLFFSINSELPSSSTFSAISLDKGLIDIGAYGICLTDQQSSQRIDLPIPDSVFRIQQLNSGVQRVNAIRDFFREWIYFCYPVNNSQGPPGQVIKFPTETFLFNYRDNTWAILYENYTSHGYYRAGSFKTWATLPFKTWNSWNEPWNSGITSALQTQVIAGNPQGYVLVKSEGTFEATSGTINNIATHTAGTLITSYNHCVQANNPELDFSDYLYFTSAIGNTFLNGLIGRVVIIIDADNFVIDIPFQAGTYLGLGKFTRLSQPYIQTKQFNLFWDQGRQTRIGTQKYLLTATTTSQITVQIFLNQDDIDPWSSQNSPTLNPDPNGLIYSEIVFTCREATNMGLTPANINLQNPLPLSAAQKQIWHRSNTSLQGDTFQIGVTLEDNQMTVLEYATAEIELHAVNFNVAQGPYLA